MLDIQIEPVDGYVVCRPVGELNAHTARLFRQILAELATRPRLVIDMSRVATVDNAALGVLAGGIRVARELGTDVAVSCGRQTLAVLKAAGFDRVVTLAENLREAAFAFAPPTPD